jgi:hypothetical protein
MIHTHSCVKLVNLNDINERAEKLNKDHAYYTMTAKILYLSQRVRLGKHKFEIRKENMDVHFYVGFGKHRIFPLEDNARFSFDIKENVILVVDKKPLLRGPVQGAGNGIPSHPLCDIFFRTEDNKLVMIDMYGGRNAENAYEKRRKLQKWHDSIREGDVTCIKIKPLQSMSDCYCIVLAPNAMDKSSTTRGLDNVYCIFGEEAWALLGGLGQLRRWF